LAQKLFAAGVVGAGGGGFPTHHKVAHRVEWVIANAAECEPLLYSDQEVLRVEGEQVLTGLRLIAQATGAQRVAIAVKKKNRDLVAPLRDAAEVVELPDVYPAGDEHEVVALATGRSVPEGGLPVQVGVLVQNVETLRNVAAAWQGEPVTHRTLTVGGCVQQPKVVRVPVGTTVRELLSLCGGAQCQAPAFFMGGVMMGALTTDPETPIDKTTAAVIVLPLAHPCAQRRMQSVAHQLRNARSACTQCVLCTETCNRYLLGHHLEPHRVMRSMALGLAAESEVGHMALLCSECGACEYACPMGLSPRLVNRELKGALRSAGVQAPQPRETKARVRMGSGRIPTSRLMARFQLAPYARPARYCEQEVVPKRVRIRLKQHAGSPARPVVRRGQQVAAGQLIGDCRPDEVSARVQASISGRVAEVDEEMVCIEAA
jgi:Na+-translocating ferredoxin:NAD+ oxidoreductase RnfC subunit